MKKKAQQFSDQYDLLTNQLIESIENNTLPEWFDGLSIRLGSRNPATNHSYTGANRLILACQPYTDPAWSTYKGWQSLGYVVQKGEKSTGISRPNPVKVDKVDALGNKTGETAILNFFKTLPVFNAEQVRDSNGNCYKSQPTVATDFNPIAECESVVNAHNPTIQFKGDQPCYIPSQDTIVMPKPDHFTTNENYYKTLFHELAHWTSHSSRCDRKLGKRFGSADYAFEELVAELTSAFVSSDLNLTGQLENHASYLKSWLKVLKDDNKALIKASKLAQAASNYIMQRELKLKVAA
jgi:antirestriction protein ArdC